MGYPALKIDDFFTEKPIDPMLELGAYETLWLQEKASFKALAELFSKNKNLLPSDLVDYDSALSTLHNVQELAENQYFNIRLHGTTEYPLKLRDAKYPVELLYYRGTWALTELPSVAVVGSRKVSRDGAARAARIARLLVENDYMVVSGLAEGVDTVAHQTALKHGGRTMAVIGTSILKNYPKQNKKLQEHLSEDHLVVSQVPILKSLQNDWRWNRMFFPERNKTMSALTKATVIVEAGETSGTLTQARAALQQGRKLFILNSCFDNPKITWPAKYEKLGAIRVREFDDILEGLTR